LAWWRGRAAGGGDGRLLYLKDWHFANEYPDYQAYECPPFFLDDWLNEWLDARRARSGGEEGGGIQTSDYRFVYLGPQGTHTPLHSDVLGSHSWSVNISGSKHWVLVPPDKTLQLMDRAGRCMTPNLFAGAGATEWQIEGKSRVEDEDKFPWLEEARAAALFVDQGPDEAIFVPSGWHHCVLNTAATLSINHNWINGSCIKQWWGLVEGEYRAAAAAIEDCRALCGSAQEFEALVQGNMKANCGMGVAEAGDLLRFVADGALRALLDPLEGAGGKNAQILRVWFDPVERLQRAGWALERLQQLLQEIQRVAEGSNTEKVLHAPEVEANRACLERITAAIELHTPWA
jgi:hypothetical protein